MNRPTSKTNQLERIIVHFARVIVACLVMMWGVINLVHNFLSWRTSGWSESNSIVISFSLIVVTGILPVLIGIWILLRSKPKI